MQRWQVGDVTITKIVEFEGALPGGGEGSMVEAAFPDAVKEIGWLRPHWADENGHIVASIHALLVETPDARIMVDTCAGNGKDRPGTFFDNLQTPFLDHMEEAGWTRDSVDTVLCTHLHVDHVGWNTMKVDGRWVPTFNNARYLIGADEYAHWESDDDEMQQMVMSDSVKPIFDGGLADLVAMDHQVTPDVRLVPTPGHTPGHVAVHLASEGQHAVMWGDLLHSPAQCIRPDWAYCRDTSAEDSTASRNRLLSACAEHRHLVLPSHFPLPSVGRVHADGAAWWFTYADNP